MSGDKNNKLTAENVGGVIKGWLKHYAIIIVLCAAIVGIGWFAVVQFKANIKAQAESEQLVDTLNGTQSQLQQTESTLQKTEDALEQAQNDLTYTKEQNKLLEDTAEALNRQVTELNTENTGLKSKVKDLEKRLKDALNIKPSKPKITTAQLQEQISSIAELTTLKYIYTNSSRKEGNLTWLWGWAMPFTDSSLLVTYDGTIKAGIDFKEIKFAITGKTITVTMPKSRVLDHNIPQGTINVLEVKNGLFNPITFDDYNKFITEEKKVMEEKAIAMGLLKDADEEAKSVVDAFLKSIPGMEDYTLAYK